MPPDDKTDPKTRKAIEMERRAKMSTPELAAQVEADLAVLGILKALS